MPFLSTSVSDAVSRLKAGALVALPTETVYGLAADAANPLAVSAVFTLKGRPANNPLIVHISSLEMANHYVQWNAMAQKLAAEHWPGALTLVLPRAPHAPVAPQVSAGGDTLALRMPSHPLAREVIEAFGSALAAPSANRSGRVSPTQTAHVMSEFPDADLLILDGGDCQIGLESTVVDCTGEAPLLLRPGSIQMNSHLGSLKAAPDSGLPDEASAKSGSLCSAADWDDKVLKSPGLLSSHYAPNLPVRLNASSVNGSEALLAFGKPLAGAAKTLNLSESGDLQEAARHLYAMLRALDVPHFQAIAVMPIPDEGIGRAINDRLRRAACR